MKIVFMGTPEFALPSLQQLLEHQGQVVAVVTGVDKPAGRGLRVLENPVKQFAQQAGLPVLQPDKLNDPAFIADLQKLEADLFIVVAFRILPRPVFAIPPRGTINLHAALLPKYRGAAPIQWAIINGETETGVTTFFIDDKMDTGEILLQENTPIGENDTAGDLHDRLAVLGAKVVLETVTQLAEGRLQSRPQHGETSLAPKITKDMAQIDWRKSARYVRNFVRGMNPVPAAFTHWQNKLLKIFAAEVREHHAPDVAPGEICFVDAPNGELWIQTGEARWQFVNYSSKASVACPRLSFCTDMFSLCETNLNTDHCLQGKACASHKEVQSAFGKLCANPGKMAAKDYLG
jgi:methionyl-tRNA formyltransferase